MAYWESRPWEGLTASYAPLPYLCWILIMKVLEKKKTLFINSSFL